MGEVAAKKRISEDELVQVLVQVAQAGPVYVEGQLRVRVCLSCLKKQLTCIHLRIRTRIHGTVAAEVRFHDDQSTYTGVHKAGGPTIIDREKATLETLLDRSEADVRGVTPAMREAVSTEPRAAKSPSKHAGAADTLNAHLAARVEQTASGKPSARGNTGTRAMLESKLSHRLAEERCVPRALVTNLQTRRLRN